MLHKRLISAFNRGTANLMCHGQPALANPTLMGFKYLQPIRLGSSKPRANAGKSVSEIAIAIGAVVLGHAQVQHHDLVALTRVLERTLVRRFNAHRRLPAMHAGRTLGRSGPNMNIAAPLHALNY
nr:hypothetical protein [Pollutimonas subterranea]